MPLKIVYPGHQEIIGKGLVLLVKPPTNGTDQSAGTITEETALVSKSHAIIASEGRSLDRSKAESDKSNFITRVHTFLDERRVKCVIELNGRKEPGIEIRTGGASGPSELLELVSAGLAESFEITTTIEPIDVTETYSKDGKVQVIRVFLGPDERGFRRDLTIERVAYSVGLINRALGYSETDEGAGDSLD